MNRVFRRLPIVILAAVVTSCGGGSSTPVSPGGTTGTGSTGSTGSGPACRTYATAYTTSSAFNGRIIVSNIPNNCSFDTSTNQITCTIGFGNGGPICQRDIVSWHSTADFVNEIQSNPPRELDFMSTATLIPSGPCGSGSTTNSRTNTYDSQQRLVRIDVSGNPAASVVYSQWDSKGRPTVGTYAGVPTTLAYDDAAGTITISSSTGTTILTYDPNGILVRQETHDPTGGVSTTTHTVQTTGQVCK